MARVEVDPVEAADYIVKYSLLAKSKSYIKGVWWYDLSNDGNDMNNQEHNFGFAILHLILSQLRRRL